MDLNESSQLCAQSLFVRSKVLPLRTWLQKWKRDSWTQHLFGRILKPSLGQSFVTAWTSSLAATHANHFQAQESDSVKTTQGTYGLGSQMEFDLCDQGSVSSRTSRDTSASDSERLSRNWKGLVIKRRGEFLVRLKSARLTNASACLYWPTVQSCEAKSDTLQDRKARGKQVMLCHAVRHWPTSSTRDWKGCYKTLQRKDGKPRGDLLPDAVNIEEMHGQAAQDNTNTHGNRQESWETATVSTGGHRQKDGSITPKLDQQVKAWATPRAEMDSGAHRGRPDTLHSQMKTQSSGKLNPRWVETLMGLPIGWVMPSCTSPVIIGQTNCGCLEMESCR